MLVTYYQNLTLNQLFNISYTIVISLTQTSSMVGRVTPIRKQPSWDSLTGIASIKLNVAVKAHQNQLCQATRNCLSKNQSNTFNLYHGVLTSWKYTNVLDFISCRALYMLGSS